MIFKKKYLLLTILLIIIVQIALHTNNKQRSSFRYFKWTIQEISIGKLINISFFSGLFISTLLNTTITNLKKNTLDKKIFKNWEEKYKNNKIRKFKNVNPQIIPRNHIIEEIINEVYSNNYGQLYEFEKLLKNPYEKIENKKYITPPLESEKVFETFCGT